MRDLIWIVCSLPALSVSFMKKFQKKNLKKIFFSTFSVSNSAEIKKYLDTHPHKISISDFNWSGNFSKEDFNCRSDKLKEMRVCPGYWNGSISEEQMREMEQSSMLHCSAMRRYKYLWMPIGSYIDFHHNIRLSQERGYNFFQDRFSILFSL